MEAVVVAGGAGFIGSHLCERLLQEGDRVICIDNFSTGKKENISHLMKDANFSLLEQDITSHFELEGEIGQVYNLASPASPVDFGKMPVEILLVNSLGTMNLLELAKKKNAVFLQASTSEVYGDPLEHPQKESYWGNVNPVGKRSCYDEGKRFSEALAMAYARNQGVQVRIARIFNTFGPRMRKEDGRVVPNMISQAISGRPMTVYGKGSQTRSFCFVSDLVQGLIKLMNSDYGKPVNIGNPKEITILELAESIKQISGSGSKIVFDALPEDDPSRRKPDISVAEKELNWQPRIGLEEGLQKTIGYFRQA
jgi:nucleoside-diphosphate-sugar epimerase